MPDSQPNYLSTDASGRVTASFSGGLILPIEVGNVTNYFNSVTWTRAEDGSMVARTSTQRNHITPPPRNTMTDEVRSPNNAHTAYMNKAAADGSMGGSIGTSYLGVTADAASRILLNNLGQSDFAQVIPSIGGIRFSVGRTVISYGGGAGGVSPGVSHGLGVVPSGALAMQDVAPFTNDGSAAVAAGLWSWDATSVFFKFLNLSYAAATANSYGFCWLAWAQL